MSNRTAKTSSCPFCRIVTGQIAVADPEPLIVGDFLEALAFIPLAPAAWGHTLARYRGYMQAQVEKLERGSGQREALIRSHGYDTKFAMHAARLGFQGIELLTTGSLALPMVGEAGDWLRAVRYGNISQGEWRYRVTALDAELASLLTDERYPEGPDREAIESWSVETHRRTWIS